MVNSALRAGASGLRTKRSIRNYISMLPAQKSLPPHGLRTTLPGTGWLCSPYMRRKLLGARHCAEHLTPSTSLSPRQSRSLRSIFYPQGKEVSHSLFKSTHLISGRADSDLLDHRSCVFSYYALLLPALTKHWIFTHGLAGFPCRNACLSTALPCFSVQNQNQSSQVLPNLYLDQDDK